MLLKADYEAKTVFEIDYDKLKEEGINVIAFDLDSTVMKSKSGEFSKEVLSMFFLIATNIALDTICSLSFIS